MVIHSKPYRVAVVLGRFQIFHKAHKKLLDEAFTKSDCVLVVLGSHQSAANIVNPFTTAEREAMIRAVYPDKDIHFLVVPDYVYNDTKWFYEVQAKVYQKLHEMGVSLESTRESWTDKGRGEINRNICLCGFYKDSSSYYLDFFRDIWAFEAHVSSMRVSSTDIRTALYSDGRIKGKHWSSMVPPAVVDWVAAEYLPTEKFQHHKEEYEYAVRYRKLLKPEGYQYPNQPVCGDSIVVQNGMVAMIIRKNFPGKGLWALPGGFIKTNERIQEGALRELKEETNIDIPKPVLRRLLVEQAVFDHTNRDVRARIVSHGFFYKLEDGRPLPKLTAGDDAAKAFWVPWHEIIKNSHLVYSDHVHILSYFLNRY